MELGFLLKNALIPINIVDLVLTLIHMMTNLFIHILVKIL